MAANGTAYATPQQRLEAKLADPGVAEALERLLDKLPVVAFGVDAIDGFLRRSEEVVESFAASIHELKSAGNLQSATSDFVSSLPQMARAGSQMAAVTQKPGFQNLLESGLLEKLGDPATMASLETILSKLELAAFALTAIDGFVKRGDQITDSISESLGDVRHLAESVDVEKWKVLPKLLDAMPALLESGLLEQLPQLVKTIDTLQASGLLRPELLASLAEGGQLLSASYNEAKKAPVKTIGIFGLLNELKDPDVNRSVTLLLETAKQAGKKLR
jgi:uncharacterized protein YjgD (DUF1641 family)